MASDRRTSKPGVRCAGCIGDSEELAFGRKHADGQSRRLSRQKRLKSRSDFCADAPRMAIDETEARRRAFRRYIPGEYFASVERICGRFFAWNGLALRLLGLGRRNPLDEKKHRFRKPGEVDDTILQWMPKNARRISGNHVLGRNRATWADPYIPMKSPRRQLLSGCLQEFAWQSPKARNLKLARHLACQRFLPITQSERSELRIGFRHWKTTRHRNKS